MGPFPNRPFIGSLQPNLSPVYRQAWFWAAQGGLLYAVAMSGLLVFARSRKRPEDLRAERLQREQSLHKEEDAMGEAARLGDVLAFFTSARHAIQLQLGARWNLRPEALTLAEIQQHDPQLAEVLQPLFAQADEVIYSGLAGGKIDLAQWDRHVRQLLQSQPQPA